MTVHSTLLASYVPTLVLQRLATRPTDSEEPWAARLQGAILFADLSGFTAYAEQMAQRGSEGAEALIDVLNATFSDLIDRVVSHGGDVLKFAGDAMVAIWPASESSQVEFAVRSASQCALAMQANLLATVQREGLPLSLRVGVGVGEVICAQVGGLNQHWELMITGDALGDLARSHQVAERGDVVLTPEAWRFVASDAGGAARPGGMVRLETLREGRLEPLPAHDVTPDLERLLWRYLPTSIESRLRANQDRWLAELRPVTAVFVNLPDLNGDVPLERAQAIVRVLEEAIARYEGSLNKLSVDEKGVTLIAAFGLPPLSHEDDALRAVKAAFDIQTALEQLEVARAIGISTGRAFCGEVGNDRRREYTIIGDSINLAARLMQHARGSILCDQSTFRLLQGRVSFDAVEPLRLKGKSQPVPAYQPLAIAQRSTIMLPSRMIGRDQEKQTLARGVERLLAGESGCFIVEADAGMGKSRLLANLIGSVNSPVRVLQGAGDAVEKSTPYHAWRPVLAGMIGMEAAPEDPAARRTHFLGRLRLILGEVPEPEWVELAPLLEALLPLGFEETAMLAQMSSQARADNTDRLLVWLIEGIARHSPLLLIMDDAHWLDSASWRLLRSVRQSAQVMLVVSTRPLGDPLPLDYRVLLERSDAHLVLDMLSSQEAVSLVCLRLGIDHLPESVAELIVDKAEGHPFFSEELASSLLDAEYLRIESGTCQIALDAPDLQTLDLPTTVEGVITTRVDRLMPSAQLAIKVASVIGRVFAFQTLHDVFPVEDEREALSGYLEVLERLDLTPLDSPPPELSYIFKHIITQEVVYNLMLLSQRQQLHRSVAEWIERTFAQSLDRHFPLLAHHWSKAEVPAKAVDYLEKAGTQALNSSAYPEAIAFYGDALELIRSGKLPLDLQHRGHLHLQLGKAYLGKGYLKESQENFYAALKDFDHPFPEPQGALVGSVVKELLKQVAHRFFPKLLLRPVTAPEARERLLEPARVMESLYEIFMFGDSPLGILYCNLLATNLAERTTPTPQAAWGYAMMSLIAGTARMPGVADLYERKALEIAEEIKDLPVQAGILIRLATRRLVTCQWDDGVAWAERALAICNRISDHRKWAEALAISANIRSYRGDLEECRLVFENIYLEAKRLNANQYWCWGVNGQMTAMLRLGRFEEAIALAEANTDTFAETHDQINDMGYHGQKGTLYLRLGRWQAAWDEVCLAERLLSAHTPTYAFECSFGICEVACTMLLTPGAELPAPREEVQRLARQGLKLAQTASNTFDHGKPQVRRYRGLLAWLEGDRKQAIKCFQQSVEFARRLKMPYEEALAHRDLGRYLPNNDLRRFEHLDAARRIFGDLGSRHDLELTEQAVSQLSAV